MAKSFDRFVAGRYLRAKRKQAFIGAISIITLIGITLGVAALNIALSIHNGMRRAFVENLVGERGQLYILAGAGAGGGFEREDTRRIFSLLERVPEVKAVSVSRQENAVLISKRRQLRYARLNGVIPAEHLKAADTLRELEWGDAMALERRPPGAPPGIILGADLAAYLGVAAGDPVRAAMPRLSSPGITRQGLRFREIKFEVVGVFRTGNSQFDELDAYLRLEDLMLALNTDRIQAVMASFDSIESMDRVKPKLAGHPELPIGATVMDLRDLNTNLLRALELEKIATTLVISLFILVVALNMISALTMLVMEKHRDIGVMKSFGAPRRVIQRIFIRQGMTLSVRGSLLGTVIGVGGALLADATRLIKLDNSVYEVLNYLPFDVKPLEAVAVAVGSMLVAYVTSIYPARQAASLDPVEALKYD